MGKEKINSSPTHCRIDKQQPDAWDAASFGLLPESHLSHPWAKSETSITRGRVLKTSAWPTLITSRFSFGGISCRPLHRICSQSFL
jgi:hypothetical protein